MRLSVGGAKAKGRRAQQEVRDILLEHLYLPAGLEADDCQSVTMGVSGLDVLLSPAARKVSDLAIECKNVESLNVTTTFWDHYAKYEKLPALKLLLHRRNRTKLLATLRVEDLVQLLKERINCTRNH